MIWCGSFLSCFLSGFEGGYLSSRKKIAAEFLSNFLEDRATGRAPSFSRCLHRSLVLPLHVCFVYAPYSLKMCSFRALTPPPPPPNRTLLSPSQPIPCLLCGVTATITTNANTTVDVRHLNTHRHLLTVVFLHLAHRHVLPGLLDRDVPDHVGGGLPRRYVWRVGSNV